MAPPPPLPTTAIRRSEDVEEIATAAVKEEQIETRLNAIESDWAALNLVRAVGFWLQHWVCCRAAVGEGAGSPTKHNKQHTIPSKTPHHLLPARHHTPPPQHTTQTHDTNTNNTPPRSPPNQTFADYKNRGPVVLKPADTTELIEKLEDSQMQLGAMVTNRYSGPFRERVQAWAVKLGTVSEILEQWLMVQVRVAGGFGGGGDVMVVVVLCVYCGRQGADVAGANPIAYNKTHTLPTTTNNTKQPHNNTIQQPTTNKQQNMWQYMEAVFSGGDIVKQLPAEAKRFQNIDKSYVKIVAAAIETRNAVAVCAGSELMRSMLPHLLEQLELCQKSLSAYLETKRAEFPR